MARPRKTDVPDLTVRQTLTQGIVERLVCPPGKAQAFLRDSEGNGLRVRVTPGGKKTFVFEQSLRNQTIRRTIGDVSAWTIDAARAEAKRLSAMLDAKLDPREVEREQQREKAAAAAKAEEEAAAKAQQQTAAAITVGDAWSRYVAEGSPKRKKDWKPRYREDMAKMTAPGGAPRKRGSGKTLPGHLYPLLSVRLVDINEDRLAAWFAQESRRSAHQATRALMMFRGFLRWCAARPEFRSLVDRAAGSSPAIVEALPGSVERNDKLEVGQLRAWFAEVGKLPSPVSRGYLIALLLTGARREEMAALKWADIDLRWGRFVIADKVGETRTLPLTGHLRALFMSIPKAKGRGEKSPPNPYVFSSSSASGHITEPRSAMERVLRDAGIQRVTIHGLRRTFATLSEEAGLPEGAIRQIMGHSAASVHERYKKRSLDALRGYLDKAQSFMLNEAGVVLQAPAERPALELVTDEPRAAPKRTAA